MALKIAEKLAARYSHLTRPNESVRKVAQEALKSILHLDIPFEKITVERGTIFVRAPQIVKSEIGMKKVELLAHLKKELGAKAPKDIR